MTFLPLLPILACQQPATDSATTVAPPIDSLANCLVHSTGSDPWYGTNFTLQCEGTLFGDDYAFDDWKWASLDCAADGVTEMTEATYDARGCATASTRRRSDPTDTWRIDSTTVCDSHGQPKLDLEVESDVESDYEWLYVTTTTDIDTYDGQGRLVVDDDTSTDDGLNFQTIQTTWTYDDAGDLSALEEDYDFPGDQSGTYTGVYAYDEDGVLTSERWHDTSTASDGSVTDTYGTDSYTYDALGRRIEITYDDDGDGVMDGSLDYTWQGDTPWIATYTDNVGRVPVVTESYSYDCP